jgi:hypothetical protein
MSPGACTMIQRINAWVSSGNIRHHPDQKRHAITSAGKVMLTLFFDRHGPLLIGWLPKRITVNANHCGETLECLRSATKDKRSGMLPRRIILFHDNVRPHSARTTCEKLQQFWWEVLPHSPYSPDLSPCDYHIFSANEKSTQRSVLHHGHRCTKAITLWLHSQPQDFYRWTREPVGCLSEQPWGICRITWSSCCAVHTVCLFIKLCWCTQSGYLSNNPYRSCYCRKH